MVTIRRIRPDEGEAFRGIRLQAILDSPRSFGSTLSETEARPPHYWENRAQLGAAGNESVLLIAEDGARWVGIVGGFIDDSTETRLVELVSMWVQPDYRNRGVGRRLIEHLVDWAQQHDAARVVLWVTADNYSAISLYQRCGFLDSGEIQPHPSQHGLMERRMVLRLPPTHPGTP